jgi:two-component sensor histidine kinase
MTSGRLLVPARTDRALYALWAVFWLLMIVVAYQDERGDDGVRAWEPLLWEGSSCFVATAWLVIGRRASARWQADLAQPLVWFGKLFAWLPLVAVTFIGSIYAIRHGVYALTNEIYEHEGWTQIFFYESLKLLLFATLWICIIFGLESFASWRREREHLLTLQKHLAESQLAQLRAQLQPHFLFNSLNTISSIMQVDVERADKLLTQLAELLRASLQTGAGHVSSLREELELLTRYAAIMQERFAGRASVRSDIDADTLDAAIPAMLLQPLLENAFKHGVERGSGAVAISITARRSGAAVDITIHNSGARLPDNPRAGIGIANSRERLALLFGPAASLTLLNDGDGVSARLSLPWRKHPA